jgi:hypothetical protein
MTFNRRFADQISAHRESFTPPPVENPREGRVSGWRDGGYVVNIGGSRSVRQSATNGSIPVGGVACVRGRVDAQPAIATQPKRPGVRVEGSKANVKNFYYVTEGGITSFFIGGDRKIPVKVFELPSEYNHVVAAQFLLISLANLGRGKNDWIAGVWPFGYPYYPTLTTPFWIVRPGGVEVYTPQPTIIPPGIDRDPLEGNAWVGSTGFANDSAMRGLIPDELPVPIIVGKTSRLNLTIFRVDEFTVRYEYTLIQGETSTVIPRLPSVATNFPRKYTLSGNLLYEVYTQTTQSFVPEFTVYQYDLLNLRFNDPFPTVIPDKEIKIKKVAQTLKSDSFESVFSYHP